MGPDEDPVNYRDPGAVGNEGRPEEAAAPLGDVPAGGAPAASDAAVAGDAALGAVGGEPARGGAAAGGQRTTANMLPGRERRQFGLERIIVRLIATFGVVAIGVALAAILAASKVQGWIIGLVVALVSVVLSAVLWSSRQL
jgi:hypothetical protein